MNDRNRFTPLIEELDFMLAERRHLRVRGPHVIVTHLNHIPETSCAPGEMIGDIALGGFGDPISLGFAHMSLLLMDCFCRYRIPLTVSKIEEIMNTDPFYLRYGANRPIRKKVVRLPDRSSVWVYIPRIQERMEKVLQSCGVCLDPHKILTADRIDGVTAYQLKATVEFIHHDAK